MDPNQPARKPTLPKQQILDAAERRMRRGGFEAIHREELAVAAGLEPTNIRYEFPEKAELGRLVVQRYTDRLMGFLGLPDPPDRTVEQRIQRLCFGYQNALMEDKIPCLCCVLGAESLELPPIVAEAVSHFFMRLISWTTTALGDRPDAASLAKHIISSLQGTMITALVLHQPELLTDAEPYLLKLVQLDAE